MYESVKSSLIWNNLYDNLNFCFIKKKVKKILIELIINNFNINTNYTNMEMSQYLITKLYRIKNYVYFFVNLR